MIDKEKVLSSLQNSYNFYTEKSIDAESNDEVMIYARYSIAILEIMNGIKTGDYDISEKQKETCKWELQDEWPDNEQYYSTSCDNAQQFSEGSRSENDYKYCPYCGKTIEEVKQ